MKHVLDLSTRVASTHLAPVSGKGLPAKQEAAPSSPQGFGTSCCHEELLQGASVLLQPGAEVTRPGFSCEENQPHLSAPEI